LVRQQHFVNCAAVVHHQYHRNAGRRLSPVALA
jgi:hypothetical protein